MAGLSDSEVLAKATGGNDKAVPAMGLSDDEVLARHRDPAPVPAEPRFPYDKPGTTYGTLLPFAKDEKTGSVNLAFPEAIREPVRGMKEYWERAKRGFQPNSTDEPPATQPSPDMLSAASLGIDVPPGTLGRGNAPGPTPARALTQTARESGYVLPPSMATDKPGQVSKILSGWGGKIKLQQDASVRNQEVTNGLASEALGLPKGTVLTDKVFKDVRAKAGQAYAAVTQALPEIAPDAAFREQMQGLGGANSQAAQLFPDIMRNSGIESLSRSLANSGNVPTKVGIEVVKKLRADAVANLKALGDPAKHALGLAQRQAADAIDSLIDRNLENLAYGGSDMEAMGPLDLVQKYRDARRTIAKSYDVEGATNSATGDVNAAGLARLANKGRPLSDQLKIIADVANGYPKAMQNTAKFGGSEPMSGLDFFASALAMAHGNPSIAGMILGRPIARGAVLSRPYQRGLVAPSSAPPPVRSLTDAATRNGIITAINPPLPMPSSGDQP